MGAKAHWIPNPVIESLCSSASWLSTSGPELPCHHLRYLQNVHHNRAEVRVPRRSHLQMQALGILSGTVIQGEENKLSPLSYRPLLLVRRATPESLLKFRKQWPSKCGILTNPYRMFLYIILNLNSHTAAYTKINSKWITDLNIKPKTLILQEKYIRENLWDLGLGKYFLDIRPKCNPWKNKMINWTSSTWKCLLFERYFQENERQVTDKEKIHVTFSHKIKNLLNSVLKQTTTKKPNF